MIAIDVRDYVREVPQTQFGKRAFNDENCKETDSSVFGPILYIYLHTYSYLYNTTCAG